MKEITISVKMQVPDAPAVMPQAAAVEELSAVVAEQTKAQAERLWGNSAWVLKVEIGEGGTNQAPTSGSSKRKGG